ncbi:MAG TPA: hypothetical protein VI338_00300 [Nitrososphaera sp.]|nr:hypothetical protein [Nitrososphaera sp.]
MCANHETAEGGYYSKEMKVVALSILVMGISLAIVMVLWAWFGHIGPRFSDEVLLNQQKELRDQYGLPPAPPVTEEEAQIPPSLRGK